jgi:hypothetical protein
LTPKRRSSAPTRANSAKPKAKAQSSSKNRTETKLNAKAEKALKLAKKALAKAIAPQQTFNLKSYSKGVLAKKGQ